MDLISNTIALGSAGVGGSSEYWYTTLGFPSVDLEFTSMDVDSSGNLYATTRTVNSGGAVIAKYDNAGVLQWQRFMAGSNGWGANPNLVVDSSGNIYWCAIDGTYGLLVVKLNNSGVIQWQTRLGVGSTGAISSDIALNNAGEIYCNLVYQQTSQSGTNNCQLTVIKLTSAGVITTRHSINSMDIRSPGGLAIDQSNNDVYMSGSFYNTGNTRSEGTLLKKNSSLQNIWTEAVYDALTGSDITCRDVTIDSVGQIYMIGEYDGKILLVKYFNSSGTFAWTRKLGDNISTTAGFSITTDANNYVYVCGHTDSNTTSTSDVFISKFDTNGGTVYWNRQFGGTGEDKGRRIKVDSNGNVYVAGFTESTGAGPKNGFILKVPDDGSLVGTYGSVEYKSNSLSLLTAGLTDLGVTRGTSNWAGTPTTPSITANVTNYTSITTYL